MFAHVSGDAAQDVAARGQGSFDEQRHMGSALPPGGPRALHRTVLPASSTVAGSLQGLIASLIAVAAGFATLLFRAPTLRRAVGAVNWVLAKNERVASAPHE